MTFRQITKTNSFLRKIPSKSSPSVEYLTDEREFSRKAFSVNQNFSKCFQISSRQKIDHNEFRQTGRKLWNPSWKSFRKQLPRIRYRVLGKLSRAIGYQRDYPRQKRQSTFSSQAGKKEPSFFIGKRNTVQRYRSPHLHTSQNRFSLFHFSWKVNALRQRLLASQAIAVQLVNNRNDFIFQADFFHGKNAIG